MGLENIRALCRIYDDGHQYIAFTLATEVRKVLVDNPASARTRGEKRFPTPKNDYRPTNLAAELPLAIAQVHVKSGGKLGEVPTGTVTFLPTSIEAPLGMEWLLFREWWNRDVIFRASAAPKGAPPHLIPTNTAEQVPRSKRYSMSRRTFVDLMRNKVGAHIDSDLPEVLEGLLKGFYFGMDLRVEYGEGALSLHEGTMHVEVGVAAAMMREIGHEVLWAYAPDRSQPPLLGQAIG